MWLLLIIIVPCTALVPQLAYWAFRFYRVVQANRRNQSALQGYLNSLSADQRSQAEVWFSNLKLLGSQVGPVSPRTNTSQPPPWYDREKFHTAQRTCMGYYISIQVGSLGGLLTGVQIPEGLLPLMVGGNHSSVAALYRRYMSTIWRVRNWYDPESGDPFDSKSELSRSIAAVRGMHLKIHKTMNETDPERKTRGGVLWVTQADMAYTQFAFIGLSMLYRQRVGLHPATQQDLEDIIYTWRVLGYVLGMEDDFNLCTAGSYGETYLRCKHFLSEDYTTFSSTAATVLGPHGPLVGPPNPSGPLISEKSDSTEKSGGTAHLGSIAGWQLGRGLMFALHSLNPLNEWTSFMRYWYITLGWETEPGLRLVRWESIWRYAYLNLNLRVFMHSKKAHARYSNLLRMKQVRERARYGRVEEELRRKFPAENLNYCDMSLGVDFDPVRQEVYGPVVTAAAAGHSLNKPISGGGCPLGFTAAAALQDQNNPKSSLGPDLGPETEAENNNPKISAAKLLIVD